jgi:hypothetical protein
MSLNGTARYANTDFAMPPLVLRAVAAAEQLGFEFCVHPSTGRLLQVLESGLPVRRSTLMGLEAKRSWGPSEFDTCTCCGNWS